MSTPLQPLEDRVVIKVLEVEKKTESGLIIPDSAAKDGPQEGEILAVGPGKLDENGNRIAMDVKVGDVVIYSKFGGTGVKYAGQEFLILSSRDLLAIVKK